MQERTQTPPNVLQSRAALKLYERLISPGGPATYQQLAEDLGVVASTVHRQCTGDVPVQLRTVLALLNRDPEGGRQMLDILGDAAHFRWTDTPGQRPAEQDAIDGAWMTVDEAAQLQQAIARAARDGRFDAGEREDARHRLARMEHRCKAMHAQLDALEAAPGNAEQHPKAARA